jgi:LemA protein
MEIHRCKSAKRWTIAAIIGEMYMKPWLIIVVVLGIVLMLAGGTYNSLQSSDEQVKASWSEVLNQYQRRADLVPNLVSTVKAYATHEKEVLEQVTVARSRVGSIQATPELLAQGELSGALSRLLLVAEQYPNLKADANFRDLQAQLEGTENRIAVARNRYIKSVQDYNVAVRSFPSNIVARLSGFAVKPNFTVENEKALAMPPKVDFGAPETSRQTVPAGSAQ